MSKTQPIKPDVSKYGKKAMLKLIFELQWATLTEIGQLKQDIANLRAEKP